MYMFMSVLVPTCTVTAAQFFFFFSSRLLTRMRAGDEKHRNKNVCPNNNNSRQYTKRETLDRANQRAAVVVREDCTCAEHAVVFLLLLDTKSLL